MKKSFAIALALCMILSICSFSAAAAPEGTAITSEAEFLAMDPAGTYYLANDITVATSYAAPFNGTLDGNGKTVTVSEPMFLTIGGTVKNLTIKGEIVASHDKSNGLWQRGALACNATAADGTVITVKNVTNYANVTGFTARDTATYPDLAGYAWAGGLIGALNGDEVAMASLVVEDCVNYGNVTSYQPCGGIIGSAYCNDKEYAGTSTLTVLSSANYGNVDGINSYAGGIAGRVLYTTNATFTGCVNNGNVTGVGNIGGIVGHTTCVATFISFCQNNGAVSTVFAEGETPYAGGILGYGQGTKFADFTASNNKFANKVEYCINTGDVTSERRTGGIVGSTGASGAYGLSLISNCINLGKVTNNGNGTGGSHCCAGGILGYGYGSKTDQYAYIENCINTGTVVSVHESEAIAANFIGYINSKNAKITNNIGIGTLEAKSGKNYVLGQNNAGEFADATGNKTLASNTYVLVFEKDITETAVTVDTVDEAALASGQIIFEMNEAYKAATGATADAFYMTAGTFAPTLIAAEDGSNAIVKNADGSYGNPVIEPEVTDPVDPAPTGDSALAFAVIALISVFGVAMIAKRREN